MRMNAQVDKSGVKEPQKRIQIIAINASPHHKNASTFPISPMRIPDDQGGVYKNFRSCPPNQHISISTVHSTWDMQQYGGQKETRRSRKLAENEGRCHPKPNLVPFPCHKYSATPPIISTSAAENVSPNQLPLTQPRTLSTHQARHRPRNRQIRFPAYTPHSLCLHFRQRTPTRSRRSPRGRPGHGSLNTDCNIALLQTVDSGLSLIVEGRCSGFAGRGGMVGGRSITITG